MARPSGEIAGAGLVDITSTSVCVKPGDVEVEATTAERGAGAPCLAVTKVLEAIAKTARPSTRMGDFRICCVPSIRGL
jgi:hypothetical protein